MDKSQAVRTDLLEELATALENHKETEANQFNLGYWHRNTHCGTSACAMGLATTLPSFEEAGFKLDPPMEGGTQYNLRYRIYYGFSAVSRGLGIGYVTAYSLFSSPYYQAAGDTSAAQVAARIRSFLALDDKKVRFSLDKNDWEPIPDDDDD